MSPQKIKNEREEKIKGWIIERKKRWWRGEGVGGDGAADPDTQSLRPDK